MHTKKITRNRLDWRGSWMCRSKVYRPTGVIGPFAFRKPTKFAFSGIRAAFGSACRFAQWYCLWEVEHLRSVLRLSKICTLTPQVGLRLIGHFSPSLFFQWSTAGLPYFSISSQLFRRFSTNCFIWSFRLWSETPPGEEIFTWSMPLTAPCWLTPHGQFSAR